VLIMIEAHTLDAWTRLADRNQILFRNLTILGGFAAPLFLMLAGLSVVLAAEHKFDAGRPRRDATIKGLERGLWVFVLAFLFRLQAFVVSPGSAPITLFRVDILNVMGPAMAAAALVWGVSGRTRRAAIACAVCAAVIGFATPIVRAASWVDRLPDAFQWYLRPSGVHTTFTLLPWSGFVFAGSSVGCVLRLARGARVERRAIWALGAAAAALVGAGFYTASLPALFKTASFWTSSPTYFAIRVGITIGVLVLCFAATPLAIAAPAPFRILERFGRHSLFVYWIHVELVYGYATWLIHRRLPVELVVGAYLTFSAVMYGAVQVRRRVADRLGRSAKPVDFMVFRTGKP
jgi:uncharacterized membrane protein